MFFYVKAAHLFVANKLVGKLGKNPCRLLLPIFGPYVLEMVCISLEPNAGVWLMVAGRLTKTEIKKCFLNPSSTVFCSLYPPPFLPKSSGFLGYLGVFIILNLFLLYLVFKVG